MIKSKELKTKMSHTHFLILSHSASFRKGCLSSDLGWVCRYHGSIWSILRAVSSAFIRRVPDIGCARCSTLPLAIESSFLLLFGIGPFVNDYDLISQVNPIMTPLVLTVYLVLTGLIMLNIFVSAELPYESSHLCVIILRP